MIPTPRPYQRDGLDAVALELISNGVTRQLLQAPTGTGKTVTFAALLEWPRLKDWLAQFPANERHMLVIAHRKELLNQAAEKIQRANPDLIVTIDQAERRASVHSDVVVAGIQTLAGSDYARLERLMHRMTFRVVVVDEAHHTTASTYVGALERLGFLPRDNTPLSVWDATQPKDKLLLGVTATPNRSDAVGLSKVYQKLVYSYRLRDAIRDGYLVPITPWAIDTDTSLDDVRTNHGGDFVVSALSNAVNTAARNTLALTAWQAKAERLPTIAFTVDVAHAHALADTWVAAGYTARALSGETPDDERADILRSFECGQLDAVMNCMVLTEGTDLPRAACILHAKPTKSATLYEQMTGRGLRPLPPDPVGPERLTHAGTFQKPGCVVIDIVDVARRHSLQAAPMLYGLPSGITTKGERLDYVSEKIDALRDKGFDVDEAVSNGQHLTLEALHARASLVDLWAVQELPASFGARKLVWLKVAEDVFQCEYPHEGGYERLRVELDLLGQWSVVRRSTPPRDAIVAGGLPVRPTMTETILAGQILTSEAAASVAEAFVGQHRPDILRLRAVGATWRTAPASAKQLEALARRRVPHNPKVLTKGQASDLLDLASARGGAALRRRF